MKKTIFTLLVVLLTMLAITCDSALVPQKVSSEAVSAADPDFVTVGINIADDKSRAMTQSYAETIVGTDGFYEVVFVRGSTTPNITVRDNIDQAKFGAGWKVTVPRGNYLTTNATADKAVLFVGQKSDKTLLAIGVLTLDSDFTDPGSEPANITFGLTAITSELSSTIANSSFGVTGVSKYNVQTETETIESVAGPLVHNLPVSTSDVTISGTGTYTFTNIKPNLVLLADSAYPSFVKAGQLTDTTLPPGAAIIVNSVTAPPSTLLASQPIVFTFTTDVTPGYVKILVEVPVFAINTGISYDYGKPEAIMWYIRGGIDNKKIDKGGPASTGNDGGAVLIKLSDPDSWNTIIDPITTPWP